MALVPPPEVLDELDEALAPHRAERPDLRWSPRELMHVTLAFFGETDDLAYERLLPRLERVAGRYPEMTLSLAGGGAFPGGGAHARVLWTGLYGDRRLVARLAASVNAAGRRAGCPIGEYRGFRAHLTLARSRTPADLRALIESLSMFAGSPWTAGALHLVRSHLGSSVHHETLRTWPLSGERSGLDAMH